MKFILLVFALSLPSHTQDFTLHVYLNCDGYLKGGFQFAPGLLQRCPART